MNPVSPAAQPGTSQQAVVQAALLVLERMGLSPADLTAVPQTRKPVPTFAEYVPVVSARGDPPGVWLVLEPPPGSVGRPPPGRADLWVPKTYATRRYSWMTPLARSCRRTRK
jgi:hypothetical protein